MRWRTAGSIDPARVKVNVRTSAKHDTSCTVLSTLPLAIFHRPVDCSPVPIIWPCELVLSYKKSKKGVKKKTVVCIERVSLFWVFFFVSKRLFLTIQSTLYCTFPTLPVLQHTVSVRGELWTMAAPIGCWWEGQSSVFFIYIQYIYRYNWL